MALLTKAGALSTGTAAAGNTVVVTGVGFVPKVIFFFLSGRTDTTDAIGRASHKRGFGFAISSTDRRCIATHSIDAQTAGDADALMRVDACFAVITTAAAIDGLMDLQSMDADGFTLVIDDAFTQSYRVGYLALGGDSITNVNHIDWATDGTLNNQSETGIGFQPDCLLFFSHRAAAAADTSEAIVDSAFSIGVATSSTNQAVWTGGSNDAAATIQAISYCLDGVECMAFPDAGFTATTNRQALVSMDADGFTIDALDGSSARRMWGVALKGGNYKVVPIATRTDGADIVTSGYGFVPSGGLILGAGRAEDTQDVPGSHDRWSMGAFSSAADRVAMASLDEHAVADSEVTTAVEHDAVYINIKTDSTRDGLMDVKSMDADGVTFVMDDADPGVRFAWGLMFGPAAGGTLFTRSMGGGSTPVGAIVRQPNLMRAGSVTSVGTINRQPNLLKAGSIASIGSLARMPDRLFVGTMTPTGAVSRLISKLIGGSVASIGGLVRQVERMLISTITPAGAVTRQPNISMGGAVASSGAVERLKALLRTFTGTLASPVGIVARQVSKALGGAATPMGSLARQPAHSFTGAVTAAGSLIKQPNIHMGGSLTSTGTLSTLKVIAHTFSGQLAMAGSLARQTNRMLGGSVSMASSLAKQVSLRLGGTVTTSGSIARSISKLLGSLLTAAGSLIHQIFVPAGRGSVTVQIRAATALPTSSVKSSVVVSLRTASATVEVVTSED